MKKIIGIFFAFCRVGALTFGGGYGMLPIANKELCDNKKWVSREYIADCYAVAQCAPGIIAVNTSVLLGNSLGGVLGGIAAAIGIAFPSLIIILLVTSVLNAFIFLPIVGFALSGIRAAVCAIILNTVLGLSESSVVDAVGGGLFMVSFVALTFFDTSPIFPIVLGAVVGLAAKGGKKL
ncbi:MAG: chromate transporter [Oscillospiraceae bacterium]